MAEYNFLKVPQIVVNIARARSPRIQESAIQHLSDDISRSVQRGDWVQVDADTMVTDKGIDPIAWVEEWISTRPYAEVPAEVIDAEDETWTSGNLGKQGERWKQLRAMYQPGKEGDKLATDALTAEAALYGVKPGSITPGVKPGTKAEAADGSSPGTNPWDKASWRGSEAARQKAIDATIKWSTSKAASLAKAANVTLSGHPLGAPGAHPGAVYALGNRR